MTGKVDGALNQAAGTVPVVGPPGAAKDGMAPLVVATSVEPAGAGEAWVDGVGPVVLAVALVAGGAVSVVDAEGEAALRPELLQAGISTQRAKPVTTATERRRLMSPGTAESHSSSSSALAPRRSRTISR
jgi:hypothetical protein